jgi:predicted nuclease of predicted toxin-antitoxin system
LKILFDEGAPRPLKDALAAFTVDTVQGLGLAGRPDADILRAADAAGYEVFVTTDKDIFAFLSTSCPRRAGRG